MKILKSPAFFTGLFAFVLWFTPLSRSYGIITDGLGQKIGMTTGKQIAFFYLFMIILPVVLIYYVFKWALKPLK